jgi:hypothetical protein
VLDDIEALGVVNEPHAGTYYTVIIALAIVGFCFLRDLATVLQLTSAWFRA